MRVLNNGDHPLLTSVVLDGEIEKVTVERGSNTIEDRVWAELEKQSFISKRVAREVLVVTQQPVKGKKAPAAGTSKEKVSY